MTVTAGNTSTAIDFGPHVSNGFRHSHVLSMSQFTRNDLELLYRTTDFMIERPLHAPRLTNRVMLSAFFERSTRTRLAHETAMLRLGGSVSGFADADTTRSGGRTQENHVDILQMASLYSDVVVVRHTQTGWTARASEEVTGDALIINAGDGDGEHPTQTMVDLFTLRAVFGSIDGLNILVVNDLGMRCVHSLLSALRLYDCTIFLPRTSMEHAGMTTEMYPSLKIMQIDHYADVLDRVDVIYSSPTVGEDARQPQQVILDRRVLDTSYTGRRVAVLHPLPRGPELDRSLDDSRYNGYWQQAAYGVPLRMALVSLMFDAVAL